MKVKLTVTNVTNIGEVTPVPIKLNYAGTCPFFEVGQEIIIDSDEIPEGFCHWAWKVMWTSIMTIRRGGDFNDIYKEKGKAFVCCPDAARPVSFLIERVQ